MYRQFVARHRVAFGANLKMAEDIAEILDHPLAQVWEGERYSHDLSEKRCEILKGFFALCVQSGVPLPLNDDVFCCGSGRNQNFLDTFLRMFQPVCLYPQGTFRPVHVLIVDDTPKDLLSSAYALIGIPNLTVDLYHCDVRRLAEEMSFGAIVPKICEDITLQAQDVVLMDEGLGLGVVGHELVEKFKEDGSKLLFVANTRGLSISLEVEGCFQNFNKGSEPAGMLQALKMYC